ncbi:MAG: serine hydrolase domain-containing protein [Acidobacteriota bacterium]
MKGFIAMMLAACAAAVVYAQPAADPWPKSIEEFRLAVQNVLSETGVPGAGIALVRASGVEWAGGVGVADRDTKRPVTADTHFRAGSISKTFIASAIVQLYLDDLIDLDTPVAEIAPELDIDNAWEPGDPVRVIHLLQHTAGFDDMHFNEMYNLSSPRSDLSLESVLAINPRSRVVRWRPGTRWSYSNPGYTVAGYLIEKITGKNYEDVIAERIFTPVKMPTSSFYLTKNNEALLARGYEDRTGPPVPYTQIYLRPSGNLHTSALELGRFVHLLLNWGETENDLVIDPEYLSNMEHPRTTLASAAGLRSGYGSGIASLSIEGFPMLGHGGGIDGFISQYAYSTSRDVGFVVLLNSTYSPDALRRIQQLAVRYLKADVEAPETPRATIAAAVLHGYEGYYHDASPRNQAMAFLDWLLSGRTISVSGDGLLAKPVFGKSMQLIPVSDSLFRLDRDPEATLVFTKTAEGVPVLAGGTSYAEKRSRWPIEIVRWGVLASAALVITPLVMVIPWIIVAWLRRGTERRGGILKCFLLLCAIALILPVIGVFDVSARTLGMHNVGTTAIFAGSVLMPFAAIVSFQCVIDAWRKGAGRGLRLYGLAVSMAALIVSGYLSAWGMIAFMPWSF